MDMIGDTTEALLASPAVATEAERRNGRTYLLVYGVLQALFLQQDAVSTIRTSVGLGPEWMPANLKTLREIRNDSVGHPQKRNDGSAHFIVRSLMSPKAFQLYSFRRGVEGYEQRWIDVPGLIDENVQAVIAALDQITGVLETRRHPDGCDCRL
ncbi:MAG: hypothetical protein Q8M79_11965 [Dehalococcoidia bacterium]|nr:hypothetical protein [Dehalococcoidia bacterium]